MCSPYCSRQTQSTRALATLAGLSMQCQFWRVRVYTGPLLRLILSRFHKIHGWPRGAITKGRRWSASTSEKSVEQMVTVIEEDAHERVEKLKGPIDIAFSAQPLATSLIFIETTPAPPSNSRTPFPFVRRL